MMYKYLHSDVLESLKELWCGKVIPALCLYRLCDDTRNHTAFLLVLFYLLLDLDRK